MYSKIRHVNPDGSGVDVDVRESCSVGLMLGVTLGDYVQLGVGVHLDPGARVSNCVSIGDFCQLGRHVVLAGNLVLPPNSFIRSATTIRPGQHLHGRTSFYHWDAYVRRDGTKMFRHGCVTLPLREWTEKKQRDLTNRFHPPAWGSVTNREVLRDLARAVRTARAFLQGIQ